MPPQNWSEIADWLNRAEKSAGTLPESSDGTTAATDGGARGAENSRDVKAVVGGNSAEGGAASTVHGRADNMAGSTGLKQTTVGKMPDVERAVKVIEEETEKASKADVDDPAQLEAAHAAVLKAAAELPTILARSAVRAAPSANGHAAPAEKSAMDKALAATIENYRRYGEDHADVTTGYLRGFWDTLNHLKAAADAGTLEQMLGAGAGGDPEGAAGAGAPPPEAAPAGPMGAGGDAGGDAGGGSGGDPGMDDFAAAAAELGLAPEELMQLIEILKSKAQSEPMGPADKVAVERVLTKAAYVASEIKNQMRAGKFQLKPAADGTPERGRRQVAANFFNELLQASR